MEETQNSKVTEAALIPELTINVKGLALVYKKNNEVMVKMRIPEVDDHDPIISITTDTQIGTEITSRTRVFSIPIGGSIEITHTGALPSADPVLNGVIKVNGLHPGVKFKPVAELTDISALITVTNAKFTFDDEKNWISRDGRLMIYHPVQLFRRENPEVNGNLLWTIPKFFQL